jgi:hypothetical protein
LQIILLKFFTNQNQLNKQTQGSYKKIAGQYEARVGMIPAGVHKLM